MSLPAWMFSPAWWIAFWSFVAAGVLVLLYFSIARSLREIEEAEAELDASPYLDHAGPHVWLIHPAFHDRDEST